jgi:hypothetical protein
MLDKLARLKEENALKSKIDNGDDEEDDDDQSLVRIMYNIEVYCHFYYWQCQYYYDQSITFTIAIFAITF